MAYEPIWNDMRQCGSHKVGKPDAVGGNILACMRYVSSAVRQSAEIRIILIFPPKSGAL